MRWSFILLFVLIIIFILSKGIGFKVYKSVGNSMSPTINSSQGVLIKKIDGSSNPVERFDIVTFRINEKIILKRVVGIPNDTLIYKDGLVIVKLKKSKKKIRLNNWHYRYLSTLSDSILVIPNYKYFLLGDNLKNSNDSRDLGFIDINSIHGKYIFSF